MGAPATIQPALGDEAGLPLPMATRAGFALLLAAMVASPWPYGCVAEPWRWWLTSAVLSASALMAWGVDVRPGFTAVLPLAAIPVAQVALGTAPLALALDAALALWAPLAAWLSLRQLARGRRAVLVATVVTSCALVQAAFGLIQGPGRGIYGHATDWMTSSFGSFINHNHFAGFAEMGTLLALGLCVQRLRRDRELSGRALLWAGAAALIALAVLASRSRGGLVALAAGLAAFALLAAGRRSRRRGALLLGVFTLAMAAALAILPQDAWTRIMASASDGSLAYRLHTSLASLRLAAAHPLLGSGLGSFPDAVTAFKRGDGDVRTMHAENDVLEFVAETGLLGLAALLFAAWRLRPALAATLRSSALAAGALAAASALAVHSFVDFNLRVPSNALMLAVCLALALPGRGQSAGRSAAAAWRWAIAGTFLALGALASCAAFAAAEHARGLGQLDPLARAAILTRALDWNPLSPEIRRDRARALVRASAGSLREVRLERAGADYHRVLALRPRWAEAWYELAWVELARGDRSAARSALQRATALDPTSLGLRSRGAALLARIESMPSSP